MAVAPYAFCSRWDLPIDRERLWGVVEASLRADDPLPWWDRVHVRGRDGDTLRVTAHSGLGYRLHFTVDELRLRPPEQMTFRSTGDLVGTADLRFVPVGRDRTLLLIDWHVEVARPWMRRADVLLRPVFIAAHAAVMRRGERRLRRWLSEAAAKR
ncbi:hypothetical protein [uncultured Aeromicrobium sp.]|uniref:hypothetical protein n=1 Tax=uncultured Aeromicrobium sp. TaxID=337820 RepID=UPI0025E17E21|nr:hypothetical protein [uncultured Aeromicrobium sp.]